MKLKTFNSENCVRSKGNHKSVVPSVGINMKTGLFRFNVKAIELLDIKEGDQLMFHQDEDEPADWYMEKVAEKGFELRAKVSVTKGLLFNNTVLARNIADSVAFTDNSGKCLIAGEPTELKKRQLWGLLTGTLRNK